MTPSSLAADFGTPTSARPLWPAATLGTMVLLIVVLVARLVTVAPAVPATLDRGTNYLDSTAFAAAPASPAVAAHPLPTAGR